MGMKLNWGEVAEFRRKSRARSPGPLSPVGLGFALAFNAAAWGLLILALKGCG